MKKTIMIVGAVIIIGFLIWKSGYISNPDSLWNDITKLKGDIVTSFNNLKNEGQNKIQQAEDIKKTVDDKLNKLNKATDAIKDLTK